MRSLERVSHGGSAVLTPRGVRTWGGRAGVGLQEVSLARSAAWWDAHWVLPCPPPGVGLSQQGVLLHTVEIGTRF